MLNNANMIDSDQAFNKIKPFMRAAFFDEVFDANQFLSKAGGLATPFVSTPSPDTKKVTCEAQLKLQSPLADATRSAPWLEYWSRSVASQFLPNTDQISPSLNRGLGESKNVAIVAYFCFICCHELTP